MIKVLVFFAVCYLVYSVVSTLLTWRRITRSTTTNYRDIG